MDTTELIKKLHSVGLKPYRYSGRGMMGKYCVGANVGPGFVLVADVPQPSTDSMGMGSVYYWRASEWESAVHDDTVDVITSGLVGRVVGKGELFSDDDDNERVVLVKVRDGSMKGAVIAADHGDLVVRKAGK